MDIFFAKVQYDLAKTNGWHRQKQNITTVWLFVFSMDGSMALKHGATLFKGLAW
jgi:hypothetical protein